MHDAVAEHAHVGVLIATDDLSAAHAARKHRVDRPGHLFHGGIVATGGNVHGTRCMDRSALARSIFARPDERLSVAPHCPHAVGRPPRRRRARGRSFARRRSRCACSRTSLRSNTCGIAGFSDARRTIAVWPQLSPSRSRALSPPSMPICSSSSFATTMTEALSRAIAYRNSAGHAYENSVVGHRHPHRGARRASSRPDRAPSARGRPRAAVHRLHPVRAARPMTRRAIAASRWASAVRARGW